MLNIRLGTEEDIESLLKMGEKFYSTTQYPALSIPWDEDSATKHAFDMLDLGFVLMVDDEEGVACGMAGFLYSPFPLNNSVTLCTEMMFWLNEDKRSMGIAKELIEVAERVALEFDDACGGIVLGCLATTPEHVPVLYKSLEYDKAETLWIKEL